MDHARALHHAWPPASRAGAISAAPPRFRLPSASIAARPSMGHYVDDFLGRHRALITGRVLEIQASGYTQRFGQGVTASHTLDIDPKFAATYTCDLSRAQDVVPDNSYDCFLLPNTLQHLQDIDGALDNILRIVRPGGAIIATAAAFIPLIPDGPDYWRITADGWHEQTSRHWPHDAVEIAAYGNCLAAIAAIPVCRSKT